MMRGSNSNSSLDSNASIQNELELLLLQQNRDLILERERELNINRSGSAPPTIEGALRGAGGLFGNSNFGIFDGSGSSGNPSSGSVSGVLTEEEILSHPAYLEYYYSNENLNPRLPPPLLSKEDWRIAQWIRAVGLDSGDWRNKNLTGNSGNSSLFSAPPGFSVNKKDDEELRKAALRNISRKNSANDLSRKSSAGDLLEKDSGGASSSGMGVRRKSFADILQEGLGGQPAKSNLSRPASQSSLSDAQNKAEVFESKIPEKAYAGLPNPNNISSSFPSSVNSPLSNNVSKLVGNSVGPGLVSVGGVVLRADNGNSDPSNVPKAYSPSIFEIADAATSLSELNMLKDRLQAEEILRSSIQLGLMPNGHLLFDKSRSGINSADLTRNNRSLNNLSSLLNERMSFPRRSSSTTNLQPQMNPSDLVNLQELMMSQTQSNNFLGSTLAGAVGDGLDLRSINQAGIRFPVVDPNLIQYIRGTNAGHVLGNVSQGGHLVSPYDLEALEKAYLQALLLQKKQHQSQILNNNQYAGKSGVGPSTKSHQGNTGPNPSHSKAGSKNPTSPNERSGQVPSNLKNLKGESSSSPNSQAANNMRVESLLEMIKNNKTKSLELSDVLSHVVDFSTNQYGSRFVQQKLETANPEKKMMIFKEIIPHARSLMVDVFGNYVIQKFFEHGSEGQRKELARSMIGHVLSLSFQMYGCRVVQKALEVVDPELQTQMVAELNGSVMKCVRDQNGNHVIQKCIECVPQDKIQFIISAFFGQVVVLSTHPYGCRVIQRVLEHCVDPKTQKVIMEEIIKSVCNLAQDQYGNYVIQHVLQHGKPHERSAIIKKLAGQIVKMSQQKFASNVVEKCLTFGGPEERKLLVNEMLGSTDENEPLQAMMKDPFGNYVVQKVLETCDDHSRELILSRIKVHLEALKKYTYGKHIVSRVEKLVATGEKHIGQPSSTSS